MAKDRKAPPDGGPSDGVWDDAVSFVVMIVLYPRHARETNWDLIESVFGDDQALLSLNGLLWPFRNIFRLDAAPT
jgi:hypothetical protein